LHVLLLQLFLNFVDYVLWYWVLAFYSQIQYNFLTHFAGSNILRLKQELWQWKEGSNAKLLCGYLYCNWKNEMGAHELGLTKSLNVRKSHGIQSSQIVMLFLLGGTPSLKGWKKSAETREKPLMYTEGGCLV
jgi:hypothetical protein